jgi:hypothetical protein
MRLRPRTLVDVVLLALLVGLGLIAYFQPGIERPAPVPQLTALAPGEIDRIELDYPGGRRFVLTRQQDGWYVTDPIAVPANEFQAKSLEALATASSFARYRASELDLARLKLDPPLLQIRFNDTVVGLGDTESLEGRRYVLNGDVVHLVTDSLATLLDADLGTLASHALLPAAARPVSMRLPVPAAPGAEAPFQGERELRMQSHRWVLEPADETVSQDIINTLVDGWRFAHALEVEPYQDEAASLGTVVIELKDEPQALRFDIVGTSPELVLERRDLGLRYHLAEPLGQRLLRLALPPAED